MSSKHRQSPRPSSSHPSPDDKALDTTDNTSMPEPSSEPKPLARQQAYEVDRIGDILRRVREHRGEDLESISDYLRIRANYLVALENSRYEDLPADAYVIGFLRTYALYLGLDGKGAIDQYRREMAGRRRKPQLSMPQPMPEGRAPTIAVLIGAAVAALLVYAIWYGLSSPDTDASKKTVFLPPATETTAPTTPQATEAKPEGSLSSQTATSDGIALTVPASAVPTTAETKTESAKDAKGAAKPAEQAAPVAVSPEKTVTPPPAAEPAKDTKETKPSKEKGKVEAAPQPTQAQAEPAKDIALEKGKGRLSIKAEKESWVLVTDSKGNTIFEKTLKPGETYTVPSNKGLKLTTGNASGVSFNLDGATLPKLGPSDTVVRAVPLDPDKLKSRLNDAESSTAD